MSDIKTQKQLLHEKIDELTVRLGESVREHVTINTPKLFSTLIEKAEPSKPESRPTNEEQLEQLQNAVDSEHTMAINQLNARLS